MSHVSATVIIAAPIKEVFEFAASPFNGPAFIPNLNENTNVQPLEPSLGQTFDWRFNLAGIDVTGEAEVVKYLPFTNVTIKTTGDSDTTWEYTFTEVDGGTQVTAKVAYTIKENVLARLATRFVIDRLNQKTAEQMLDNLKTILEV